MSVFVGSLQIVRGCIRGGSRRLPAIPKWAYQKGDGRSAVMQTLYLCKGEKHEKGKKTCQPSAGTGHGHGTERDDTGSIIITGVASGSHTFSAYQIFDGDYDGNVLSNVVWGSDVSDGDAALAAIKGNSTLASDFADCETAADVAEVLANETNNSDIVKAFAKVMSSCLDSSAAVSTSDGTLSSGSYTYTISGLDYGYYLVLDNGGVAASDDAYSTYILLVAGSAEIETKAVIPTNEKDVLMDDGETWGDYNTASIGDKVSFKITSQVPDVSAYTKYFFIVNDTLSEGLTFNGDVTIKIGSDTLIKDTDYTVSSTVSQTDGTTAVQIVFKDAVTLLGSYTEGTAITITYSATVNEDADMTIVGNSNESYIKYSNNPNVTPTGDGDTPGPEDPTGTTPTSETTTYVTGIQITKVDGSDNTIILTGAKFKIEGISSGIVYVNSQIFKEDTSGTYYRLTNGTYTKTEPTDSTSASYDSTTIKYSLVTEITQNTDAANISTEGYVNSSGIITFEGLGAGTYTITETVAPSGYNKLKDSITVTISMTQEGVWNITYKVGSGSTETVTATNNLFCFNVENNSGSTLPSTGGMGTTVFYIIGGMLVFGAVVVLITRRRMRTE